MTNVQRAAVAWSRRFLVALVAALVLRALSSPRARRLRRRPPLPVLSVRSSRPEPGRAPYSVSAVLPREDPGVHDRYGVRMRRARGVLYDFPRGQSTYGLLNLSSYLVTDDQFYLDSALAQAHAAARDPRRCRGGVVLPQPPSKIGTASRASPSPRRTTRRWRRGAC